VGVTAGSREVPGRKPVTRDNYDDDDDDDDDNNNNNNNNLLEQRHEGPRLFFEARGGQRAKTFGLTLR
jgi:hypothetical protein